MNTLYFACRPCCDYIDAGDRWAYWELEKTGIVARGAAIAPERVFEAISYWSPGDGEDSAWLRKLLPQVRSFLEAHRGHPVIYGDSDHFLDADHPTLFSWMHVAGFVHQPTPRYWVEVLHLSSWSAVEAWVAAHSAPWWWQQDLEQKRWARSKLELLVRARSRSGSR